MKITDLYQKVTSRIIAEMESGVVPWKRPWENTKTVGSIMPHNGATGRAYSGINIPLLWHEAAQKGYERHLWMTFNQALELGGNVVKGERSTNVVFTTKFTPKNEEDEKRLIPLLKVYHVFNVAQCEGLPKEDEPDHPIMLPIERVQTFIDALGADVRFGGNMAAFVPSKDFITMPQPYQFATQQNFYATLLHEHVHWSGHDTRLKRDLTGRFKTRSYAAEELIAELGAAFLCAHLGIEGDLRHSGYISTWIELLRQDDRAIFTASSHASRAAEYLRGMSEPLEDAA